MKSNDVKKGTKLRTTAGFDGEMFDNKRGNTRTVKVAGLFGESIGSTYVWDIAYVYNEDGEPEEIELTESQKKTRATVKALGF